MTSNNKDIHNNDVNETSGAGGTLCTGGTGVASGRGSSKAPQVVNLRKPYNDAMRCGTSNVRTMNTTGKLENIKLEMKRLRVNILGLTEVRWLDGGDFYSDDVRVIYSGGKQRQRGVV